MGEDRNAARMNSGPSHAGPEQPDPLDETWRTVGQVFSGTAEPAPPTPPLGPPGPPPAALAPYEPTPSESAPFAAERACAGPVPGVGEGAVSLPAPTLSAQILPAQDDEATTPEAAPPPPTLGVPRHSGPKPPMYAPEPRGVPAVRDDPIAALVPDMVVDGAAYGPLAVRAASVRGDSHRYHSEPRQDSLVVTRIGEHGDELLLLAVADGVGSATRAHVGSQEACRLVALHLDAAAAQLAEVLRAGDRSGFSSLVGAAVQRVATFLVHHARERGDDPAAYATTLRALLVPLDPAIRTRGFLAVGDGSTALLRDAGWHLSVTDPTASDHGGDGMIDTRTAALPYSHVAHTQLLGPALPGDVLVLCTDGLSTPLASDGGMRDFLRSAWGTGAVPAPADFLWQLQYRVKTYDDDRTAVVLWEGTP